MTEVILDYREKGSGIQDELSKKYGFAARYGCLASGDYLINGKIAVERKTTKDFIQSLIDGRLFKQAAYIKRDYDFCFLIIEGEDIYSTGFKIHPHAVRGALVSLCAVWQLPVLFSKSAEDTALLIYLLSRQNITGGKEPRFRYGRRPKRLRRRQAYIVESLPGVGPKLALRMLDKFKGVEKIFTAFSEDLMTIDGLGARKAKAIREVLVAPILSIK